MNQETASGYALDSALLRATLPEGPGVYLFKDGPGEVIYVGKAKNLKKRVLSYFRPSAELPRKTALMMNRAKALEYILTGTDNEAFILESSLIRKWMPRYNIILRDDKRFLSLRLNAKDPYPRLTLVRRIKKDGARYYGPFSSAQSVRSTLRLIDRIFQLRKCKGSGLPKRSRPCLNYQVRRCLGPCTQSIAESAYKEVVDQVALFLEGRNRELLKQLKKRMERASEQLHFEEAALTRDQVRAVKNVIERQHVVSPKLEDQDVIGLSQQDGAFELVILFVRKGYLSGTRDYLFENKGGSSGEVMEAFLKQYYHQAPFIPKRILVSDMVEDLASIAGWISELAGKRVSIQQPRAGEKRRLVEMALANAENLLKSGRGSQSQDLMELSRAVLQLRKSPWTIEGVDISNLQGDMPVGAIVSFVNGVPYKAGYKNYRIRAVSGIDDYAMMAELVERRLQGGAPPDLFVVDGGRAHLQAVKRVMEASGGSEGVELVSIAKGDESGEADRVYVPGRKNPLSLRHNHPVLHLLMRVRDEAHRRAVAYHRTLRRKAFTTSELDRIPGLGPARKRTLLRHFGDINAILRARPEELEALPGITRSLAQEIVNFFGANEDFMG
jgi:excinuclease ABC subunit C